MSIQNSHSCIFFKLNLIEILGRSFTNSSHHSFRGQVAVKST